MATERLFSYGTLQLESVQRSTFNRLLTGEPGSLVGYALEHVLITDQAVVEKSGMTHHPILRYTGHAHDEVTGTVFTLTRDELAQADDYEVDDYVRVSASLKSGGNAWVYVDARTAPIK